MKSSPTTLDSFDVRGSFRPRPIRDPLLLVILGTAIVLTALIFLMYLSWGSGRVLADTPWYIPVTHSFAGLAAFSVAFLAFGRYPVLRDAASYWIGIGFVAIGIQSVFFTLAWPGLLPGGQGIIARLPSTSGWIALFELASLSLALLASVLSRWPGWSPDSLPEEKPLAGRRWLWSAVAWTGLVILICVLFVAYEQYLPVLVGPHGNLTPLILSLDWIFMLLFSVGAYLSAHRYWRTGDALLGYVAITQIALTFVVLTAIIGAKRYDIWYYLSRVIIVGGFLTLMFGLLSEYVRLYRRENEGRLLLDAILENIPIGLAVTGGPPDYPLARVSRHGLEMNQRPAEGLLGSPAGQHQAAWRIYLQDGITQPQPEQMPLYRASRIGEETRNFEMVMEAQDGQKIPVLVNAAPIRDTTGQIIAAVNSWLDISEIKQAQALLQERENRYRELFTSMNEATALVELIHSNSGEVIDYIFHEVNPTWERMAKISRERAIGKTAKNLFQVVEEYWLKAFDQVNKTGEPLHIEEYGGGMGRYYAVNIWKVGENRCAHTFTDVTERKQAEAALQKYAKELERANRDLRNFTVIASHDLQEPLRKIEVFGEAALAGSTNLDESQYERILRMRKSAQQMRNMLNGLHQLTFLTTDTQPFQPVDLHQVTLEIVGLLETKIQQTGGVVEVEDMPVIEADPNQMRMLILHLIENALKFQPPGGKPQVKVHSTQPDPAHVQVSIEDNGIGFDEAYAGHLFEPFERLIKKTQTEYEGSGMGLAVCRRIVERHSGEILAKSRPGQGTKILITLPVQQQADPYILTKEGMNIG